VGGGGRREQGPERREWILSFIAVFCVLGGHLPSPPFLNEMGEKNKKTCLVFCVWLPNSTHTNTHSLCEGMLLRLFIDWMPLTEWTLSQAVLSSQAAGCVYWCVLYIRSQGTNINTEDDSSNTIGQASSNNPPQIL